MNGLRFEFDADIEKIKGVLEKSELGKSDKGFTIDILNKQIVVEKPAWEDVFEKSATLLPRWLVDNWRLPWVQQDWRRSATRWTSFQMGLATYRRFWWTQQWFTGYATWAVFMGIECEIVLLQYRGGIQTNVLPGIPRNYSTIRHLLILNDRLLFRIGMCTISVLCAVAAKTESRPSRNCRTGYGLADTLCPGVQNSSWSVANSTTASDVKVRGYSLQRRPGMPYLPDAVGNEQCCKLLTTLSGDSFVTNIST